MNPSSSFVLQWTTEMSEWQLCHVSGDLAHANSVAVSQETKEDSFKKTWCHSFVSERNKVFGVAVCLYVHSKSNICSSHLINTNY